MYSFTEDLKVVINNSVGRDGKVIIYIDDLDRCSPGSIVEIVEALIIFLDLDKCVFLLGMDHKKVSISLGYEYSKLDGGESEGLEERQNRYKEYGADFLKKIVQLPLGIPPMRRQEVDNFSSYLLPTETASAKLEKGIDLRDRKKKNSNLELGDEIKQNIKEMLLYLTEQNPREIKRYVNTIQFY